MQTSKMEKSTSYTKVTAGKILPLRRSAITRRSDSNFFIPLTDHDEEESTDGSIVVARSHSRRPRRTSFTQPKLSPSFAAAMLSLPWPPSELITRPSQGTNNNSNKNVEKEESNSYPKLKEMLSTSNSVALKQLQQKLNSKSNVDQNDSDEDVGKKEPEYLPFSVPTFDEVHTGWPGFVHEPVPEWKAKYLIAKPYPKDSSSKSKSLLNVNQSFTNHHKSNNNIISTVPSDSDDDNENVAGVGSKGNFKAKVRQSKSARPNGTQQKPRRRLVVERVGSCIR